MSPAPALPTKTDIFGVCTAIGRDVGFHPDILRVAFAVGLFVNAWTAIGLYAGLGVIVAAGRWLFPDRKPAVPAAIIAIPAPAPIEDDDRVRLLEAA